MADDTRYFYNSQHLNRLGSETFSAKLAGDLAPLLQTGGRAGSSAASGTGTGAGQP